MRMGVKTKIRFSPKEINKMFEDKTVLQRVEWKNFINSFIYLKRCILEFQFRKRRYVDKKSKKNNFN